jgi:hypothetical protein
MNYPKKHLLGWYVRVRYKKQLYWKYFSEVEYGSAEEAFEAALDFRDTTEREIGKLRSERPVVGSNPRNKSGVLGIRRIWRRSRNDRGRMVEGYEVTWSPIPGKVGRTFVSINKYGEEGAFQRACEIRKAKLNQYCIAEGGRQNS